MLSGKASLVDPTRIGLALVGLMWVFPFLHPQHQYPLTTFDQEWLSALLGVSVAALLLHGRLMLPRIALLPVALIGVLLLQAALGMMAYLDQAWLYLMYLLFALLLMVLGAGLRDRIGLERLSVALAFFLLAGTELNALLGVLQQYRWHTPFDAFVVVKVGAGVYGNLAQRNHFADYIVLGLVSLGLLLQMNRLPKGWGVPLAIPLLFVLTLSGSRSSWLYLIAMLLLALWGARDLLRYCALLLAGFALMHGVVQLPFMNGATESVNTVQRMFGTDESGGIRLYLWHEAWLMFKESPWLGAGFGQFAWQHFLLGPVLHRTQLTGLYNNAHNLVFQIAAEAGLIGLAALLVPLGLWLHGLRRAAMRAPHWWGYALLGVLAIHSLLEYPMWYAYFLAIAAFLLGAFDRVAWRIEPGRIGRMSTATLLLLGFLSLLQLKIGYQTIRGMLTAQRPAPVAIRVGDWPHAGSVLSPYVVLLENAGREIGDGRIEDRIAQNGRLMRFIPTDQVVYRQAFLLAQAGRLEQAKRQLACAIWSYPGEQQAHAQLVSLAEKDPAHFAALLEFEIQIEQELVSAIHNK